MNKIFIKEIGKSISYDPSIWTEQEAVDWAKTNAKSAKSPTKKVDLNKTASEVFGTNFDLDKVDTPVSVLNTVKEESPLSAKDRMKMSFGDTTGNINYLKQLGYKNPQVRDGGLMVEGNNPGELQSIDPFTLKDIPYDIAEYIGQLPIDIGQAAGMTLGASSGPGTSYLGGVTGATAGELLRQKIGESLGVYSGENSGTDMAIAGGSAAFGQAIPIATKAGGKLIKGLASKAKDARIPERMYALSTNTKDVIKDSPEAIEYLIKSGIKGSRPQVASMAAKQLSNVKSELANILLEAPEVSRKDLLRSTFKYIKEAAPGNKKLKSRQAKTVIKELLDELYPKQTKMKKELVDSLTMETKTVSSVGPRSSKASLGDVNAIKSQLQDAAQTIYNKKFGQKVLSEAGASKAQVQSEIARGLRELVENVSQNPEAVKQLNQKAYGLGSLIGGIDEKTSKELAKSPITGMDAISLAFGGPKAVAIKKTLQELPASTWAGTKSASAMYKLLDSLSKINTNKTQTDEIASVILSMFPRNAINSIRE